MDLERLEWLEPDGLGGYASGTAATVRTRRYHALLLVATTPPTGRIVLVNGCDAWVETPGGTFALSSQRYTPDVLAPDSGRLPSTFTHEPWPRWSFRLPDGTSVEQELFVAPGAGATAICWRLSAPRADWRLHVRPFLSGREHHATHHENAAFRFDAAVDGPRVTWRPYPNLPPIHSFSNATFTAEPYWYRSFFYREEAARGLDSMEDLGAPGVLHFDLSRGPAVWLLGAGDAAATLFEASPSAEACLTALERGERERRARFATPLHRAADAYLVQRGTGRTIIAGYPWFTDWGRDTFIALRGLCLALGRLDEARSILLPWAGTLSHGMLPNRFPDYGHEPEFNAVDASLWFIVAVHDFLAAAERARFAIAPADRRALLDAIEIILSGYSSGTRFNIHAEADGLLAAGEPGQQLTWMDAKVGDWVVTPRIGKPVEVQALWLNALHVGAAFSPRWRDAFERGKTSFVQRFWNESEGALYDVVDCNHQPGVVDPAFRPNQILAVGGLPLQLVHGRQAERVVAEVERRLLTPLGLRTLAPGSPGYCGRYGGGPRERDGAYHQGTVWPWLLGPFVEAWVRVRGDTPAARRQARERFVTPLLTHLEDAGLGHLTEVADGDAPHAPGGCPFQAWSLGELLRLEHVVLAE